MICDPAVNDARSLVPNELKLLCALPPKGGGVVGEGEVGSETGAYIMNMLTHQHAMHTEPRHVARLVV